MARWSGTLPDGAVTTSKRTYIRAWRRTADLVAAFLGDGWKPIGFEPGVLLRNGSMAFDCPGWLARRIVDVVEDLRDRQIDRDVLAVRPFQPTGSKTDRGSK